MNDDTLRLVPWLVLALVVGSAASMLLASFRERLAKRRAARVRGRHGIDG